MALGISKPAEAAYAIASIKLLPTGLIGLIVVAILTASMSTMDTGLNNFLSRQIAIACLFERIDMLDRDVVNSHLRNFL